MTASARSSRSRWSVTHEVALVFSATSRARAASMSAMCSSFTSGCRPHVIARSSPIQPAPTTATLIAFMAGMLEQQPIFVVDAGQDAWGGLGHQDHVFDADAGPALDV